MSVDNQVSSGAGGRRGRLLTGVALLVAFGIGFMLRGGGTPAPAPETHDHSEAAQETIWTCSMHPQIKLPKPGQCPICGMDLIPLVIDDGQGMYPDALVLSEAAVALAEIETAVVERKAATARIRLIGKVDYDETLYRMIAAWVPGRIDTLFVDFTGTSVRKGERLVSLYSPELYAAQAELLNAVRASHDLAQSRDALMRDSAQATVFSARQRLKLWGLTEGQIDRIAASEKASDHVDITSPLSGIVVHKMAMEGMYFKAGKTLYTVADLSRVWVTLNAYESDLGWLQEGQAIDFTVEALPGREFAGDIIFIDPVLNNKTRTVMVRIDADNSEGLLKPGMFVNAVASAQVGAAGGRLEPDEQGGLPLLIPATAPLITGKRAVVYVRIPGAEKPTFAGREIVLGPRVGESYVVLKGLAEGEIVVTNGNFKIDSALQIQAKVSMMNPPPPVPSRQVFATSAEFRDQLRAVADNLVAVSAALAADDDATASAAVLATGAALAGVQMELLAGEAHLAWMPAAKAVDAALGRLQAADDIEARRQVLGEVSDALWSALETFGVTTAAPVRLFHCPMANDGAGANWLQKSSETLNPFFGSAMLRCGSQVDSLVVSSAPEGR